MSRYNESMNTSSTLRDKKDQFAVTMELSPPSTEEIECWIDNIDTAFNPTMNSGKPNAARKTDAPHLGWDGVLEKWSIGDLWSKTDADELINYFEIFVDFLTLKSLSSTLTAKHVLVIVDNTTTEFTIWQMGTSYSSKLDLLDKVLWLWCISHNIWLTMAKIPGEGNSEADANFTTISGTTANA